MNSEVITVNGNRRSGIDRREFSYTAHLPERRSDKDRREEFNHSSVYSNESKSDVENPHYQRSIIY